MTPCHELGVLAMNLGVGHEIGRDLNHGFGHELYSVNLLTLA